MKENALDTQYSLIPRLPKVVTNMPGDEAILNIASPKNLLTK